MALLKGALFLLRCVIYYHILSWLFNSFDGRHIFRPYIDSDAWKHPVEYARDYGYDSETHLVTTEDNVVLEVHRVQSSKLPSNVNRIPVLLQHGLMSSSFGWMANLPNQSLAFILADAGYDVWLANSRGNIFGKMSQNKTDFWAFTKDHLALIDLPATIDYVLKTTNKPYLHCAGHSQGGFILLALLSERPEYAAKVRMAVGLAPVLKLTHTSQFIANSHKFYEIFRLLPDFELHSAQAFPDNLIMNPIVCQYLPSICFNIVKLHTGGHPDQVNLTRYSVYASTMPAGSSLTNFRHYTQTMYHGKFAKFDYGPEGNVEKYGTKELPEYQLSRIEGRVALFYCEGDEDLYAMKPHNDWLVESIPKKSLVYHEAIKNFGHLDFQYGIDAKRSVYDRMIAVMRANED